MPSKTIERTRSRRGGDESSPRSSKREQGWGAVARRQEEVTKRIEEAGNSLREFWLKTGESAIIQILQEEPYCFDAHQVKDKRGKWTLVPCQLNTGKH